MLRDAVDGRVYEDGLLALWQHRGGQYALPSDWDTIALVVNLDHVRAAGVDVKTLQQLDWNPHDGGSLGRLMARLTLDDNGRRLGEPGFEPKRVKVYGYQNPGPGGMLGQTEWSHFAASAGWSFQDRPWDGALRYGDPLLVDTLHWLASLPARGVSATPAALGRLGADAAFQAGRVAMVPSGSWMVGHFLRHARFAHAWVPLPVGPSGQRASMRNGLGLSVWQGSPQAAQAWLWVRYAASRACQAGIAQAGVIYPAIKGLGAVAITAQRAQGADTSAFSDSARGLQFAPPVVPRAAEVNDLMQAVMQRILSGRAQAAQALPEAARRVRELTQVP
jgi:multiple sugar transport system substrate-binding protein